MNFIEFIKKNLDNQSVIYYLENQICPNEAYYPKCRRESFSKRNNEKYFCNIYTKGFNVKTNTIMQNSKVSSNEWLYAIYYKLIYLPSRMLQPNEHTDWKLKQ